MAEINFHIRSYERARQIIRSFSTNEIYLRTLVVKVTGNSEYADSLDYSGLLREGKKIRGIARKY